MKSFVRFGLHLLAVFCFYKAAVAGSAEADPAAPSRHHRHQQEEEVVPTKFLGPDKNGDPVFMPLIGAGTWQFDEDDAYESVCKAFSAGYTFVDTAYGYKNQKGVGKAIKDCWKKDRKDLFVMTKIPGGLNATEVQRLHEVNLEELDLDYVDHLMTHFPSDWEETNGSPDARREEWLALEAIYYAGEARTIGISHYCSRHILDIMWAATVTPSVNQVEYHVGSQDVDSVIDTCSDFGITFMSFSPLCGPCEYEPEDSLVDGSLVDHVASHYQHKDTCAGSCNDDDDDDDVDDDGFDETVTGSQVALRYIVQQGIPVIPKSNIVSHISSNLRIFDFELSEEHMALLGRATKPAPEAGDCDVAAATDAVVETAPQ